MNFQNKIAIPSADKIIKSNITALVACLMGDEDRTHLQPRDITPDMLPQDMANEKMVLEAIYEARNVGISPTKESIANILYAKGVMKEPLKYINDNIWPQRTDSGSGARELAAFVMYWYQNAIQEHAIKKMEEIHHFPSMDAEKKYQQASELWNYAAPHSSESEHFYSEDEWHDDFDRAQAIRADNFKAGIENGPGLPWPAHKAFFSGAEWGEISSIMADTGLGKTTLVFLIAEYNAWKMKLNSDVHIISLETPKTVLQNRQFSRHTLIDYNKIKTGEVDLREEPWRKMRQAFKMAVKDKGENSGDIRFSYEPSRRLDAVLSEMQKSFEFSRANGRGVIFIIDYFQKFEWASVNYNRTEAFEIIAERLAGITHSMNVRGKCHTIIMAQENVERGEAYGSAWLRKVSQLMFSLKRFENNEGELARLGPDNKPLLDAHGRTRYWYTRRDKYVHMADLEIAKGNDSVLGTIKLKFENNFYKVEQDEDQIKELKRDKVVP